mmetsp:Transcript_6230/g.799  ORF Transcript_6230/g.799 Transcript_6230/m.799 type:complete len:86 (+) Transcript_6230:217-474(+)
MNKLVYTTKQLLMVISMHTKEEDFAMSIKDTVCFILMIDPSRLNTNSYKLKIMTLLLYTRALTTFSSISSRHGFMLEMNFRMLAA